MRRMTSQSTKPRGCLGARSWAHGAPLILWKNFSQTVALWTMGGTLFLSMLISLAELFSMLWKFLARDAALVDILKWIGLGIPPHILDSLPVAFLFAIVITLSNWHASNELEAVFSAGISLQRFLLPLFGFALAFCAAEFYITDVVSIPFLRARNTLQAEVLKESDSRATVPGFIAEGGRFVYTYRYFDERRLSLYDVVIVEKDHTGHLLRKLSTPQARWVGCRWVFSDATIYEEIDGSWRYARVTEGSDSMFVEPPSSFSRPTMDVRLLSSGELRDQINFLKAAGLPWVDAAVEKERRVSFSLTPLIVIGLAAVFAGRFRRSILLLSMLFSLTSATFYYVAQMIASLAAKAGMVSPVLSMWSVVVGFSLVSTVAYVSART